MSALRRLYAAIRQDTKGAMLIETAIVAPVLAMLSLGAFDVSRMIARQSELQSALAEAAQVALASKPDTSAKMDTIEDIIIASTGLTDAQVTLTTVYRCESGSGYVTAAALCPVDTQVWQYVRINLTDSFTPIWTDFGVGSPMNYNLTRAVLVAG